MGGGHLSIDINKIAKKVAKSHAKVNRIIFCHLWPITAGSSNGISHGQSALLVAHNAPISLECDAAGANQESQPKTKEKVDSQSRAASS